MMASRTEVLPDDKGGVWGVSAGGLTMLMNGEDGYKPMFGTSVIMFYMPPMVQLTSRFSSSPQLFLITSPISYDTVSGFSVSASINTMIGSGLAYSFTRRFGLMGAYRMMISKGSPVLNYLMIGSSVTF